jgi:hypothetical protein
MEAVVVVQQNSRSPTTSEWKNTEGRQLTLPYTLSHKKSHANILYAEEEIAE